MPAATPGRVLVPLYGQETSEVLGLSTDGTNNYLAGFGDNFLVLFLILFDFMFFFLFYIPI